MPPVGNLETLLDRLRLPTLPHVVARINALIEDQRYGPGDLGRVVAEDQSLAAEVLHMANSAQYAPVEPVRSIEQAVTMLGVRTLRGVALRTGVLARYAHLAQHDEFDLAEVWQHAARTAELAQFLGAQSRSKPRLAPDEYFTCGLLHDIGKVILLESLGEEYLDVLSRARVVGNPLHVEEERALGCSHVHVGALLAARWNLPQSVATAIGHHHGPSPQIREHPVAAVVAVADQLAYRAGGRTFESAVVSLERFAAQVLEVPSGAFGRAVGMACQGLSAARPA